MAVPMVVKTAVGIDVSKEYLTKNPQAPKKPGFLTQRIVGAVVMIAFSIPAIAKYGIPAENVNNFINLVFSNWDALMQVGAAAWGLFLVIKGAFNNTSRKLDAVTKEAEATVNAISKQEPVTVSEDTPDDPTGVSPRG